MEAGRIAPGSRLPSERELATTEGVSLMTARRALSQLEREGLVRRRIGSGTFAMPSRKAARVLCDPPREFGATECRVTGPGEREWLRRGRIVVRETVLEPEEVTPPDRPLLEFLGGRVVLAEESIRAEGGKLLIRQTLFDGEGDVVAIRELRLEGAALEHRIPVSG